MEDTTTSITLIAKWGKERIELSALHPLTTIGQVKDLLTEQTKVLPKRQKLIGLSTVTKKKVTDDVILSELKVKGGGISHYNSDTASVQHSFLLMGTAEKDIFVDPSDQADLPDVVDDFDLDFNAGSDEWIEHVAKNTNLKNFTDSTAIHVMNEPRPNKPLMVLDLDHTLLDFSSKRIIQGGVASIISSAIDPTASMKRPFMDEFLTEVYKHYDLVVWSQTSWRWLETKLTELGMLTHPGYRWCFVLDKTSMFAITSKKRDGTKVKHYVKPLQIIWTKFPGRWGKHNTVHLDDLSRNFALNLENGLKVSGYYRKKGGATNGKRDVELVGLAQYLTQLAVQVKDFTKVTFRYWTDVLSGKRKLLETREGEQGDDWDGGGKRPSTSDGS